MRDCKDKENQHKLAESMLYMGTGLNLNTQSETEITQALNI